MSSREKVNEILKIEKKDTGIIPISEIIGMIYVVYKDIEKIKNHLGIK